jgi:hypothetical protein
MNQEIELTEREASLLNKIMNDKHKKNIQIEKTPSEFRVHYREFGGSGSSAIVYSLAGSMLESVAKIKELEKELATI